MGILRVFMAVLTAAAVTACAPAGPGGPAAVAPAGQAEVGRMATFTAPRDCMRMPAQKMRQGAMSNVRSGCRIDGTEWVISVVMSEVSMPFEEAFSVGRGSIEDFRRVVAAFPAPVLIDFLKAREQVALQQSGPDWRYSNKRVSVLPDAGGVPGADACLRFSFDGRGGVAPGTDSRLSGLRCARLADDGATVQEVMLEVIGARPLGRPVPPGYTALAGRVTRSLRFR